MRAILIVTSVLGMLLLARPVLAEDRYWQPRCAEGWQLEQRKRKPEFRCAKAGGWAKEYRMGRCERPMRLRRQQDSRFGTFACFGTTISTRGGPGTFEDVRPYECPVGYERELDAEHVKQTCFKRVQGTVYQAPEF